MNQRETVAYFTMEVALEDALPTYSGGLGVLAGDYLRSAADLGLPIVAVTLCYHGGYFTQHVDSAGRQHATPVEWSPSEVLDPLDTVVTIELDGRPVAVGAHRYVIEGETGAQVPVYFLDTDLETNDAPARGLCDQLYSGDGDHRLRQEAVLGLGGVAMLEALGYRPERFHMNEGHSALLSLALLDREPIEAVRPRCAFTTHTPVPAGHDRFPAASVEAVLGGHRTAQLTALGRLEGGELNMTELGIAASQFVNAVSVRHGEVTREMFPGTPVCSITNGVHLARWAGPSIAELFDTHLTGWRSDNALIRYASSLPIEELERAHAAEKRRLLDQVVERTGRQLDPAALTIGLARRATAYKQTTLLFTDLDRLRAIAEAGGPIQVLFAGKAHPNDRSGKALIKEVVEVSRRLSGAVEVVFLESYDLRLASLLVAGTDVWLNTPIKPNEASGTSGMKAAVNGVPSLSTLDGWWIEGCVEGVTGWAIGDLEEGDDAEDLYGALEMAVLPTFYSSGEEMGELRRQAISLNGSFFNTERMAREYATAAYHLAPPAYGAASG